MTGVRQGCPLSPLIFNMSIDSLVQLAADQADRCGYSMYGRKYSVLAYADDLALMAGSPKEMQDLLSLIGEAALGLGLKFKPSKCASLHLGGANQMVLPSVFTIHGDTPVVMNEAGRYKHLGVPTGYSSFVDIDSSAEELGMVVVKLGTSLLTPWKKFDALRTFVTPKLHFIMRSGYVTKQVLRVLDQQITEAAKDWTKKKIQPTALSRRRMSVVGWKLCHLGRPPRSSHSQEHAYEEASKPLQASKRTALPLNAKEAGVYTILSGRGWESFGTTRQKQQ